MKKTLIILSSLVIAVSCLTAVNAATTNYNNENTVTTTRQQRPQFDKTKMLSNWVCKDGSTPQFDKTKMKNRPERPDIGEKRQHPEFKNNKPGGQGKPSKMDKPGQNKDKQCNKYKNKNNGQHPEFKGTNGKATGQNRPPRMGEHMMPPLVCADGSTPTRKATYNK